MPRRYHPPKPKTARPIDLYACLAGDLSSLKPANKAKSACKATKRNASSKGASRVAGRREKCLKQQNLLDSEG